MLKGKKIVVCDYPSKYLFPPNGYGGIERWLWTVAKEALALEMQVVLIGPNWQYKLLPQARYIQKSIIDIDSKDFLKMVGEMDFLVAGHEYWFNYDLIKKFEKISRKCLTYQHALTSQYKKKVFDNERHFLFCYSDQFCSIFKEQQPTKLLCVSAGYQEEPLKRDPEKYLISLGRIDKDKSPHYAILAAKKLGMPIYIIGESVRDNEYVEDYKDIFNLPHVKKLGVIFGKEKMEYIARSLCGIYTIDKNYKEPAAGTICEIIRSGVPLVGMTWSSDDSVCEPIKFDKNFGIIKRFEAGKDSEEIIINSLVKAIKESLNLDREYIYENGNKFYNPKDLVEKMLIKTLI
jgi:glycosyltransferase involved in cell wall biosynthesis